MGRETDRLDWERAYFMGIDVGTAATKGVIIDGQCRVVAQCSTEHGMENPRPGWYEHDAEGVWWHDVCQVSRELLRSSGIPAGQIAAVGTSTLGSDCLPVDEQCRPLRRAILYGIDARAGEEIAWLTEHYGPEKVHTLFGRPICSGDVAPKILWLKHHEPEVYHRTYKFLTGSSYVTAKLTGNYVVDQFLGQASFRPLYRTDGTVNQQECGLYCRPDQLAQARPVHGIAGTVTQAAARETGLEPGTPVIVGTGDSSAEAISTGVLEPGDMMLQFGSTLFLYYCADRPVLDDRVRGNNFLIPGTYSLAGGTNTCGTLTKWYRDVLFPDLLREQETGGPNAFSRMPEGLEKIPPGSGGLITLPYFAGERTPINDPAAKGVVFGLKLTHTRRHLYRSALEAVGYSVRQHLDVIRDHRLPLKKIMAVGGGAQNGTWMQLVADITGEPIQVAAVSVGAAYGDALMAALGAGRFQDFSQLSKYIATERTYQPDMEQHQKYEPYFQMYGQLYRQTKELMHQLDCIE